jgi:pumilio family protein 6
MGKDTKFQHKKHSSPTSNKGIKSPVKSNKHGGMKKTFDKSPKGKYEGKKDNQNFQKRKFDAHRSSSGEGKKDNQNFKKRKFDANRSSGGSADKSPRKPKFNNDGKKEGGGFKKSFPKKEGTSSSSFKKSSSSSSSFHGKKGEKKVGTSTSSKSNPKFKPKPKTTKTDSSSSEKKKSSSSSSSKVSASSRKPYFQLVEKMKQLWNKIRDRSITDTQRTTILNNLLTSISNHIIDISLRHDASRIIQTIIQYGNDSQREIILKELLPKFYEISKAPYGHFTILKLITYCGNKTEFMKKIISGLKNHFVTLGVHVIGARIVETILSLYPSSLTKYCKAEFYGKNFILLTSECPSSLRQLMELLPNKRFSILDHMKDLISKFSLKGLFSFQYVQSLIWEYCEELIILEKECDHFLQSSKSATTAGSTSLAVTTSSTSTSNSVVPAFDYENAHKKLLSYQTELINTIVDNLSPFIDNTNGTKIGNKVVSYIINITTAKDRKKIIKNLKGKMLSSLLSSSSSYLSIIKLMSVTDDTINIQKTLCDEIKSLTIKLQYTPSGEIIPSSTFPSLYHIIQSKNGNKLLLYLFSYPKDYLNTDHYDKEILLELRSKTSKKDDLLRKKEYLLYFYSALDYVVNHYAETFLRNKDACKVIEGMIYCFYSKNLLENLARILCHQEPIIETPEGMMEIEEETEKEADVDAEADGDEAEEEEEGDEVDNDEMDVAEEGDEEGDDEEFVAERLSDYAEDEEGNHDEDDEKNEEDFNEMLAEADEDLKKSSGKKTNHDDNEDDEEAVMVDEAPIFPIEEDPTAHVLIKKILRFEAKLEETSNTSVVSNMSALSQFNSQQLKDHSHHQDDDQEMNSILSKIDRSLWKNGSSESNSSSVEYSIMGSKLLELLSENNYETLRSWMETNRCCYTLVELFRIPSLFHRMPTIFKELSESMSDIESVLSQHEGGKLLYKLYLCAVPPKETKKEKKETVKKTKGKSTK